VAARIPKTAKEKGGAALCPSRSNAAGQLFLQGSKMKSVSDVFGEISPLEKQGLGAR
jgi:hypothetical protein